MVRPTMSYLTDIHFGAGKRSVLPDLIAHFQLKRPMVVTDAGLVALGYVERLGLSDACVFDGVETNPTETATLAGLCKYREADCDGLIALGGGSSIDLAKCVGLLVHHPEPLAQYAFVNGGLSKITAEMPPLIAIPTTSGSGSEVGRAALVTLASGDKLGILSFHLLPSAVICDPELTLGMPPWLTAGTGMDAISHCIESYCSTTYNPIAGAIALDGLKRGFANIRRAFNAGDDLQARTEMMLCSLQGGMTFQKGLGAVHSLSHPLGALPDKRLHHGTLNALFLAPVLRFNRAAIPEKMTAMAEAVGLDDGGQLIDALAELNERLELPSNLRAMGVDDDDLAPLAAKALADHCSQTNPRTLTLADCQALYQQTLDR